MSKEIFENNEKIFISFTITGKTPVISLRGCPQDVLCCAVLGDRTAAHIHWSAPGGVCQLFPSQKQCSHCPNGDASSSPTAQPPSASPVLPGGSQIQFAPLLYLLVSSVHKKTFPFHCNGIEGFHPRVQTVSKHIKGIDWQ